MTTSSTVRGPSRRMTAYTPRAPGSTPHVGAPNLGRPAVSGHDATGLMAQWCMKLGIVRWWRLPPRCRPDPANGRSRSTAGRPFPSTSSRSSSTPGRWRGRAGRSSARKACTGSTAAAASRSAPRSPFIPIPRWGSSCASTPPTSTCAPAASSYRVRVAVPPFGDHHDRRRVHRGRGRPRAAASGLPQPQAALAGDDPRHRLRGRQLPALVPFRDPPAHRGRAWAAAPLVEVAEILLPAEALPEEEGDGRWGLNGGIGLAAPHRRAAADPGRGPLLPLPAPDAVLGRAAGNGRADPSTGRARPPDHGPPRSGALQPYVLPSHGRGLPVVLTSGGASAQAWASGHCFLEVGQHHVVEVEAEAVGPGVGAVVHADAGRACR